MKQDSRRPGTSSSPTPTPRSFPTSSSSTTRATSLRRAPGRCSASAGLLPCHVQPGGPRAAGRSQLNAPLVVESGGGTSSPRTSPRSFPTPRRCSSSAKARCAVTPLGSTDDGLTAAGRSQGHPRRLGREPGRKGRFPHFMLKEIRRRRGGLQRPCEAGWTRKATSPSWSSTPQISICGASRSRLLGMGTSCTRHGR